MDTRIVTAAPLRKVRVAGGDLFHLAAEHLGDATQWYRIAQANNLWDPFLIGVFELTLPPRDPAAGNGGIMGVS